MLRVLQLSSCARPPATWPQLSEPIIMYGLCLGQKYNQKWHMSSKTGVATQIINCCCPSCDTHETHVSNVLPPRLEFLLNVLSFCCWVLTWLSQSIWYNYIIVLSYSEGCVIGDAYSNWPCSHDKDSCPLSTSGLCPRPIKSNNFNTSYVFVACKQACQTCMAKSHL